MIDFFREISVKHLIISLIVTIFLFYLLVLFFISIRKKRVLFNRLSSFFTSGVFLSFTIFIIVCIQFAINYSNFFLIHNYYLALWILLILILSFSSWIYLALGRKCNKYIPATGIIPVTISLQRVQKYRRQSWISFKRLRISLLLYLVGSIFIFIAIHYRPQYQVAIFMDNSNSMEDKLATGKTTLLDICNNLPITTHIIFGTFEKKLPSNKMPVNSISSIFETTNPDRLEASDVRVFSSPIEFSAYLSAGNPEFSDAPSPIIETIWAIFIQSEIDLNSIKKRYLIILTDGEGPLIKRDTESENLFYQTSKKTGNSIFNFFDEIKVINIGEDGNNDFFQSVPAGSICESNSITGSLKSALIDTFKQDWIFIWFFIIPIVLFIFVIMIIPLSLINQ